MTTDTRRCRRSCRRGSRGRSSPAPPGVSLQGRPLLAAGGEVQPTRSSARFLTPGWASPDLGERALAGLAAVRRGALRAAPSEALPAPPPPSVLHASPPPAAEHRRDAEQRHQRQRPRPQRRDLLLRVPRYLYLTRGDRELTDEEEDRLFRRKVRLRVEEPFKGAEPGRIVLFTGWGGGGRRARRRSGVARSVFGHAPAAAADGPGLLLIRPEDLTILPECFYDGHEGVAGEVVGRTFYGHDLVDEVRLSGDGGEVVRVRCLAGPGHAPGEAVRLLLRHHELPVFPLEEPR